MNVVEKVKDFAVKVPTYWKTPPLGRYMTYKEICAYSFGGIGAYFLIYVVQQLFLSVNNFIIGSAIGLDARLIYIIYVIAIIAGFPCTAIRAYIIDNVRNKKGKYRPYLISMGIPTAILAIGMVWVPYEKIESQVAKAVIILLFNFGFQFFYQFFYEAYENLIKVLSPNTQERADVAAFKSIVYSIAPSIATAIMPLLAQLITGGSLTNMRLYRIAYPPMAIVGILMSIMVYANTQEKIVQAKTHVIQIKFIDALRSVAKNKYFWIISLAGWIGFLESSYSVILNWLYQYKHAASAGEFTIIGLIYGNASFWGMLFAPFAIRRYGKKRVLITTNFLNIIFIAAMYPVIAAEPAHMIWVVLVCLFANGVVGAFAHILTPSIDADIRDYQQYVTGERIDGMFSTVGLIGQIVTMATSSVIPFVYSEMGINEATLQANLPEIIQNANDPGLDLTNMYNVLYVDEIFDNIMLVLILLSVVGAFMNVIPYFFYDLSETKQRGMIKVLQIRAMFEDYGNGVLQDKDIVSTIDTIREAETYASAAPKEITKRDIKAAKSKAEKKAAKKAYRDAMEYNRMIEISKIVMDEMNRFTTVEGQAQLEEAKQAVEMGYDFIYNFDPQAVKRARALPKATEKEKAYRKAEIQRARDAAFARRTALRKFPDGIQEFDVSVFESLFAREDALNEKIESLYKAYYDAKKQKNQAEVNSLKADIKAAKAEKKVLDAEIKKAGDENALYTRAAKPYIDAKKLLTQAENYDRFEEIAAMYDDAKVRHEEALAQAAAEAERQKQEEKAYAAQLKAQRAAEKAAKKAEKKKDKGVRCFPS